MTYVPPGRVTCTAVRRDPGQQYGTHTCQLPKDHDGTHLCPVCGQNWIPK